MPGRPLTICPAMQGIWQAETGLQQCLMQRYDSQLWLGKPVLRHYVQGQVSRDGKECMWSDSVLRQYWTLQVDRTGEVSTSGNGAGNGQNGADRQGRNSFSKVLQPVQQSKEQGRDPAELTRSIRDARTMQELAKVDSLT